MMNSNNNNNEWEYDDDEEGWDDNNLDQIDLSTGSEHAHVEPGIDSTQQQQEASHNNNIPVGGGIFMGRLTRFLETMTQPEEEVEVVAAAPLHHAPPIPQLLGAGGPPPPLYQNNMMTLNLGGGDVPPPSPYEQQMQMMQQEEQWNTTTAAANTAVPTQQQVSLETEARQETSAAAATGWDDDDDEEFDFTSEDQQPVKEHPPLQDGWAGVDKSLDAMLQQQAQQHDSAPNTPRSTNAGRRHRSNDTGGWDDDDDVLEGLTDDNDEQRATPTEAAVAASGWENDDDLEGLGDDDDDMMDVPMQQQEDTADNNNNGGWDEDVEGLEDLDVIDDSPPDDIVDHVPVEPTTQQQQLGSSSLSVRSVASNSAIMDECKGDQSTTDASFNPDKAEFGHVVDVVPESELNRANVSRSASMAVQSGDADDIVDDDDDDDDDDENGWDDGLDDDALNSTAGAEEDDENAVPAVKTTAVDHLPDEVDNRAIRFSQSVSTASIPDEQSAGDFLDENDETFGPVVSRLPSSRATSRSISASIAVQAPPEELDSDETENAWDADDGLDAINAQDADRPGEEGAAVVDHVPSLSGGPSQSVSTASLPGDQSSQVLQQDEDPDGGDFGLRVVDHLPSRGSADWPYRDSSMVVQASTATGSSATSGGAIVANRVASNAAPPEEAVVDHVPESETSAVATNGGSTALAVASQRSLVTEDAWETDDLEPKAEDFLQVVDHTPLTPYRARPSSRADPSTAVQAPIEEMEEDDDYIDDEDYGPVLDHTPALLQQSTVASVTESMAVQAAPSEVDDDEDMDDRVPPLPEFDERSEEFDRDDDSSDAPIMNAAAESKEEPLVDHVPRRPESRPTDASTMVVVDPSETSTVGDMTTEDQFMPVVDHTPTVASVVQPSAAGSTMANATISECPDDMEDDLDDTIDGDEKKIDGEEEQSVCDDGTIPTVEGAPPPREEHVVDHVPEGRVIHRINSETTLTIGQSIISREEIYGNVVDHLPSQHSSERHFRDGSMVVQAPPSEIDDDELEDEPSLSKASTPSRRANEREGSSPDDEASGKAVAPAPASRNLSVTFSSPIKVDETHYHDAVPVNKSLFFDAETQEAGDFVDVESGRDPVLCKSCEESKTSECPCIRNILCASLEEEETSFMTTMVMTPEGVPIRIDVNKLLQQEITKRLLLEKELGSCKATIRSMTEQDSASQTEIDGLHMNLVEELEFEQKLSSDLRSTNKELSEKLVSTERTVTELVQDRDRLIGREIELSSELDKIRSESEAGKATATADWVSKEKEYVLQIEQLHNANRDLQRQLDSQSSELVTAKTEVVERNNELSAAQGILAELNQQQNDWTSSKSALEDEISELRAAVERSAASASSETAHIEHVNSLKSEIASLSAEADKLKEELGQVRQRLSQSEAQNFAHMKESTRLSKHHDQETAKLTAKIKALEGEKVVSVQAKEASEKDLNNKLQALRKEVDALNKQKFELQQKHEAAQSAHTRQARQDSLVLKEKLVEVRSLESKVKSLEEERKRLREELQRQSTLLEQSEAKVISAASLSKEKGTLQKSLQERDEVIRSLRERLDAAASAEKDSVADSKEQIAALMEESQQMQFSLNRYESEMEAARSALEIHLEEKESLRADLDASEKKCKDLESSLSSMKQNAVELQAKMIRSEESIMHVQTDLKSAYETAMKDRTHLKAKCTELEQLLGETRNAERQELESLKEHEALLMQAQEELDQAKRENAALSESRNEWQRKLEEAQASLSQVQANAERSLADRDDADERISRVTDERDDLERQLAETKAVLAQAETKLASLETDLNLDMERHAGRNGNQDRDLVTENESLVTKCIELEDKLAEAQAEQQSLTELLTEKEEKEAQLNNDLDLLVSEREAVLQERDTLEEDNEEMLVQLGLVKQQLDGLEEEVESLRATVESKENALKDAEQRLRDAEETILRLELDAGDAGSPEPPNELYERIMSLERTVRELSEAKADLIRQLEQAESSRASAAEAIESLTQDNASLVDRILEMETDNQNVQATEESKEEEYRARIKTLDERCHHLDELSKRQQKELDRLTDRLHQASGLHSSQEQALQEEVTNLERLCAERDRALEDRDASIEELQLQLEQLSAEQRNWPDLQALQERLRQSEQAASQYLENLHAVQDELEKTKLQLQQTSEKLSATETALLDLELDMDVRDQGASERSDVELRLRDAENRLEEKARLVEQLSNERRELELQLAQSDRGPAVLPPSTATSELSSEQLQSMQTQLESLQQEYQLAVADHEAREEEMVQEVAMLNDDINKKKDEITSLEQQLQSLSIELSTSQEQLVSKETEFRRVSVELEETRAQQLRSTQQATAQVLDVSTKDEAESIENMRTHIISLAVALEKSEHQRAEAIDRLLKERKVHADSLRRLGESVKRFYSTLSCGE